MMDAVRSEIAQVEQSIAEEEANKVLVLEAVRSTCNILIATKKNKDNKNDNDNNTNTGIHEWDNLTRMAQALEAGGKLEAHFISGGKTNYSFEVFVIVNGNGETVESEGNPAPARQEDDEQQPPNHYNPPPAGASSSNSLDKNAIAIYAKLYLPYAIWDSNRQYEFDIQRAVNEFETVQRLYRDRPTTTSPMTDVKQPDDDDDGWIVPVVRPYCLVDVEACQGKLYLSEWANDTPEQWANQFIDGNVDERIVYQVAHALAHLNGMPPPTNSGGVKDNNANHDSNDDDDNNNNNNNGDYNYKQNESDWNNSARQALLSVATMVKLQFTQLMLERANASVAPSSEAVDANPGSPSLPLPPPPPASTPGSSEGGGGAGAGYGNDTEQQSFSSLVGCDDITTHTNDKDDDNNDDENNNNNNNKAALAVFLSQQVGQDIFDRVVDKYCLQIRENRESLCHNDIHPFNILVESKWHYNHPSHLNEKEKEKEEDDDEEEKEEESDFFDDGGDFLGDSNNNNNKKKKKKKMFGQLGKVIICDWETAMGGPLGRDAGTFMSFPTACALCLAVQGHKTEALHLKDCARSFWNTYSSALIAKCSNSNNNSTSGGGDDGRLPLVVQQESLGRIYKTALGAMGSFLLFHLYMLGVFVDTLPLEGVPKDDAIRALDSIAIVGMKFLLVAFDESERTGHASSEPVSIDHNNNNNKENNKENNNNNTPTPINDTLEGMEEFYDTLMNQQIDQLLLLTTTASRRRKKRVSFLRTLHRRVSDASTLQEAALRCGSSHGLDQNFHKRVVANLDGSELGGSMCSFLDDDNESDALFPVTEEIKLLWADD